MKNSKQAAIWDMDGTLLESAEVHEKAWQELFGRYDITLSKAELKEQSGKKNVSFIDTILERRKNRTLATQTLSNEKDEIVIELLKHGSTGEIYPGAKETLELFRQNDIANILATSSTRRVARLLLGELLFLFREEVYAEGVKHGKPDPEIFLTAANKLDLMPSNCVVFEDATSGVAAAKAGGFFCIARDNGLGQDLSKANVIVTEYHPAELLKYFK